MHTKLRLLVPLSALTIVNAQQAVFAQENVPETETSSAELAPVVISGKRASLASAQEIKRTKIEIVDSVVSEDINKLPDFNVTDALSRITGVQILRDRGEGAGVAIRGLTQMETLLNGREVFTAGTGRNLNFADIPSEMLAGLDVYKSSSAHHIEGGVGGMVDLRTHKPFDFEGRKLFGSTRMIYGDLADDAKPQFSTLLSDRWRTEGFGEIGALVNFTYQQRAFREDQKSAGNPVNPALTSAITSGYVPNGTTETSSFGDRDRMAGSAVLQWRPSDNLELYAEANYSEFKTKQNSHQINVIPCTNNACSTFLPGSVRLFPGSNDLQSISWTNTPISILSFARDTIDRTDQQAVGGSWNKGALTLKTDLSRTHSYNNLFFSGPVFRGTAPLFNQNLSGEIPSTSIGGLDLNDPANFQYSSIAYRTLPFQGDLWAAKIDADYEIDDSFVKSISAGYRYAKRNADNSPGLILADQAVPGNISAASVPYYVTANPAGDFLRGNGSNIGSFMVGNLAYAHDAIGLRNTFGITTPIPKTANPLSLWQINEETHAGYLLSQFRGNRLPLDGNIGLRIVQTIEAVNGSQSDPVNNRVLPINVNSNSLDYLPSLNLRYELMEKLYFRAGLSKTLTRQDFNQLSPSLVLNRNTVTPALNQGNAGNPQLAPVRSDNLDLSLEKYFDAHTMVYIAGFFKNVNGFLTTVSNPEVHDGITYQVSRPQNTNNATINGFETGYQQFYDFLPSWLSGFGLQANYTYVDSEAPGTILGQQTPLQNLSKHSFNLVGLYEKGPVSARIAYNWRDRFLSGINNFVGIGAVGAYTRAYGWLDASLGYRINDHFALALEGTNLLGTIRSSYYGSETRPQNVFANDTQVSVTATVHY